MIDAYALRMYSVLRIRCIRQVMAEIHFLRIPIISIAVTPCTE